MFDIMGRHYDKIKEDIGLKEAFENTDDDEEQTEAIFRKLRPQSKYKFSEVLSKQVEGDRNAMSKLNRMMGPMGVVA